MFSPTHVRTLSNVFFFSVVSSRFHLVIEDERFVCWRTVQPLLLSTLPQSYRSKVGVFTPWTHLRTFARFGVWKYSHVEFGGIWAALTTRGWEWRRREKRRWRQMEASLERTCRVSVLPERTGWYRGVPNPIQSRKQSGLYVHQMCSFGQVRVENFKRLQAYIFGGKGNPYYMWELCTVV